MLGWDDRDQLAAATSVQNDREACPGCGLRPDQHPHVESDLDRCPGCEARARTAKKIGADDYGLRAVFYPVADSRDSIWAKLTQKGAQWAAKHRHDPGVIRINPDDYEG